jgi:2Fe-2S ferredoxin
MSLITLTPSGKTIEAAEGMSILAAILEADPTFPHKCDGNAKCGSCHIFLVEGRKGVSKISREENAKLDELVGVGSKSRLACQAKILGTENITVEILTL